MQRYVVFSQHGLDFSDLSSSPLKKDQKEGPPHCFQIPRQEKHQTGKAPFENLTHSYFFKYQSFFLALSLVEREIRLPSFLPFSSTPNSSPCNLIVLVHSYHCKFLCSSKKLYATVPRTLCPVASPWWYFVKLQHRIALGYCMNTIHASYSHIQCLLYSHACASVSIKFSTVLLPV